MNSNDISGGEGSAGERKKRNMTSNQGLPQKRIKARLFYLCELEGLNFRSTEHCFNRGTIRGQFVVHYRGGVQLRFGKRQKGQPPYMILINFYIPAVAARPRS